MKRHASATWTGSLKDGKGTMSTETGVLSEVPFGFQSRFESGPGTNPEELLGAAHAGCFSMALSLGLGEAGFTPDHIRTRATVTIEKSGGGFAISSSHLELVARVPDIDEARFQEIARATSEACPVSRALDTRITLDAKLQG